MKITAAATVAILIVSAFAMCVPFTQGGTGDAGDPEMIAGTGELPYVVLAGSSQSFSFGINKSAFRDISKVRIEIGRGTQFVSYGTLLDNISNPAVPAGTEVVCRDSGAESTAKLAVLDDSEGVYSLNLSIGSVPHVWKYVIKVTIHDYEIVGGRAQGPVEQTYYFGAHIKSADSFSRTVVLSSDPSQYDSGSSVSSIDLFYADPISPAFCFVGSGSGYDRSGYDFYAAGLPDGLGMKLSGEISGKLSERGMSGPLEGTFRVYAAEKTGVRNVVCGEFGYSLVLPEGGFTYSINGSADIPFMQQGYVSVLTTESFTVTLKSADTGSQEYSAVYTAGDSKTGIPVTGNKIEFDAAELLDGQTGIMQLEIRRGQCTALIHILVIGPVVNSGLAPCITSS